MRNNSGHDVNSNNDRDPTLKDNEGRGGPGARDQRVDREESDQVAADRAPAEGQRSPSGRGRGEVDEDSEIVPSGE